MLNIIKEDSKLILYKYLSLNERINFKNRYYYWNKGVALLHFNKATRKFLNRVHNNRDETDVEHIVNILS